MMLRKIKPVENKEYDNHEEVYEFSDKNSGLRGFIAIHNTKLGPATGGTRLYAYRKKEDALSDVLKLSRAMTKKACFAGVSFGGGKAVIISTQKNKTKKLLEAYAKVIDSLNGLYTTGTDVGMSDEDTLFMSKITPFILKGSEGNTTTSLMAARGVHESILASFKEVFPGRKLSSMKIAIKGLGKIGYELVRLLSKKNITHIMVADKDEEKIQNIKKEFPFVKIIDPKEIHKERVDIFSPNAMGGEFNRNTIKELNCSIIVGGANNQFSNEKAIDKVGDLGILYIPDYVVNAGGLIQIVDELNIGGYNTKRVRDGINNIGKSVTWLIREFKKTGETPFRIAYKVISEKIPEKQK